MADTTDIPESACYELSVPSGRETLWVPNSAFCNNNAFANFLKTPIPTLFEAISPTQHA
jgi:hypothetical protein